MADPPVAGSTLERRYRRLLVAYPPAYRSARGDEILGTLLDLAPPGRRWPDVGDTMDVVGAGLRRRLGTASLPGLDGGLALAAPVALALAAGIAGFAWWRVEPLRAGVVIGGSPLLGVFRTLGPIAYAAWLVAAIGWAVLRPPWSRVLIAAAIIVTIALPAVAPLTTVDRPPLWVMLALVVFGFIAVAGSGPSSVRGALDSRLAVPAGAFAVAVGASAVTLIWAPSGEGFGYYYQPTIARVGIVVTAAVAVVAAVAVTRQVRRQGAVEWLWATALLGLPAGWLGPFDTGGLRAAAADPVPHFGRLAQLVLASCIAGITIAWLARRRTSTDAAQSTVDSLARAGALALGTAVGLGLFLAVGLTSTSTPAHVAGAVAVLAAVGLASRPRSLPTVLGATAVAIGLAWLVAVYDNGWTVHGWTAPARTASLVVTIALLPLSACAYAAARALRTARPVAAVILALSVGWIGYSALPYVLSWGPVLFVLVICCVAVALPLRRRP